MFHTDSSFPMKLRVGKVLYRRADYISVSIVCINQTQVDNSKPLVVSLLTRDYCDAINGEKKSEIALELTSM